jgi:hypothetical protein
MLQGMISNCGRHGRRIWMYLGGRKHLEKKHSFRSEDDLMVVTDSGDHVPILSL